MLKRFTGNGVSDIVEVTSGKNFGLSGLSIGGGSP
jgi:hypothetical protein